MKITFSNSQSQVPIKEKRFLQNANALSRAVFDNLQRRPPRHLSTADLDALRTRGSLSLTLVSNQKMVHLNKIWRQKDTTTDVLSFSLVVDDPDYFRFAATNAGLPIELGEIVISAPKADSQAKELGHSLHRELSFLFVHGLLHVLGFDHLTKSEEQEMFGRQKEVLDSLGIMR
jgi:probable rRNA maturation factor